MTRHVAGAIHRSSGACSDKRRIKESEVFEQPAGTFSTALSGTGGTGRLSHNIAIAIV